MEENTKNPVAELRQVKVKTDTDMQIVDKLKATKVDDTITILDHVAALKHLELKRFIGERDVDDRHVQYLYDEHRRGRFMWDHTLLCRAKLGDDVYGINGQHTCWMRLNLPDNNHPSVRVITYKVNDEEQLRRLYGVFDTNKSRSYQHLIKAILSGTSAVSGIWSSSLTSMAGGLRLWLYPASNDRSRIGAHETSALLTGEYINLAQKIAPIVQENWTQFHIRRVGVIAAMFATFDKVPTVAEQFWVPVATGLNMTDKNDPRYRLRELLISMKTGPDKKVDDRSYSQESTFRICIMAWNAWRNGEKRAGLRPSSERRKPL